MNTRNIETARILKEIADQVEDGRDMGPCLDVNGNAVGSWGFGSRGIVFEVKIITANDAFQG